MPKSTKENLQSNLEKKAKKATTKKSTGLTTATLSPNKASIKKATKSTIISKRKSTSKIVEKKPVKKVASLKSKASKSSTKSKKNQIKSDALSGVLEYYDLPYRYNKTMVKMLAQSPNTLFVYWDISDEDKSTMLRNYGKDFFDKTKPVLLIYNQTQNYKFEIEINDYANCWYFNIEDDKCEYYVELGRKTIDNSISLPNNYIYVSSSNKIEAPNGHILFEKEQNTIYFKNVKENYTYSKDVVNLHYINRLQKVYKIYDLYKIIYKNDEFFDVNNPTSIFK